MRGRTAESGVKHYVVAGSGSRHFRAIGHVDSIEEIGGTPAETTLQRGSYALVRGWALDEERLKPLESLTVSVGGRKPVKAIIGISRPDIAAQFGEQASHAGFLAVVPLIAEPGEYPLLLSTGDEAGSAFDAGCTVSIKPANSPLDGRRERPGGWAFAMDGIHLGDGTLAACPEGEYVVPATEVRAFIKVWAIDLAQQAPAHALAARNGGIFLTVVDGMIRNDVAASFGLPNVARCGYIVPVAPSLVGTDVVELFALSSDGSYVHLHTIRVRRPEAFSPDILPGAGNVTGRIDALSAGGVEFFEAETVRIVPGDVFVLRGWAVDVEGPRLAGGIYARIDGSTIVAAAYGGSRPDIATHYQADGVRMCEFILTLPGSMFSEGRHEVALLALSARRDSADAIGRPIVVECGTSSV